MERQAEKATSVEGLTAEQVIASTVSGMESSNTSSTKDISDMSSENVRASHMTEVEQFNALLRSRLALLLNRKDFIYRLVATYACQGFLFGVAFYEVWYKQPVEESSFLAVMLSLVWVQRFMLIPEMFQ